MQELRTILSSYIVFNNYADIDEEENFDVNNTDFFIFDDWELTKKQKLMVNGYKKLNEASMRKVTSEIREGETDTVWKFSQNKAEGKP